MQKFAFLLLAASVALLGSVVPVEAAFIAERETNGERLARGLSPHAPVKRSGTETAKRRQVSPVYQPPTGRLEVRTLSDGTPIGYVADDPNFGPNGLNLVDDPNPILSDVIAKFGAAALLVQPKTSASYYIGGLGANYLSPQNKTSVMFTGVEDFAPEAKIWTLDSTSGALTSTWTNPDGTQVPTTLIYDAQLNALNFTANPKAFSDEDSQIPVSIFLVDSGSSEE